MGMYTCSTAYGEDYQIRKSKFCLRIFPNTGNKVMLHFLYMIARLFKSIYWDTILNNDYIEQF